MNNCQRLYNAVESCNLDAVQDIISHARCAGDLFILLHKQHLQYDWSTCLHLAIAKNQLRMVGLFVDRLTRDQLYLLLHTRAAEFAYTPLHTAAFCNTDGQIIRRILQKLSLNEKRCLLRMEAKDPMIHKPPCWYEYEPNENGERRRDSSRSGWKGYNVDQKRTPIHVAAAANNNADVMLALLEGMETKTKLTLLRMGDAHGESAIHRAAIYNENSAVITAMLQGYSEQQQIMLLRTSSFPIGTTLHAAAGFCKRPEILAAMIDNLSGKQVCQLLRAKTLFEDWTPVHMMARYSDDVNVAKYVLGKLTAEQRYQLMTMINNETDDVSWTPLHMACRYDRQPEMISTLIAGLDTEQQVKLLNIRDLSQWAPIHYSACYGSTADTIEVLQGAVGEALSKALTFMIGKNGCTPAHLAAQGNKYEHVMEALLKPLNSAECRRILCTKATGGWTPIHKAARFNGNPKVMHIMLGKLNKEQKMAAISMKNGYQDSAVFLAACFNNSKVLAALLDSLDFDQMRQVMSMESKLLLKSASAVGAANTLKINHIVKEFRYSSLEHKAWIFNSRNLGDHKMITQIAENNSVTTLITYVTDSKPEAYMRTGFIVPLTLAVKSRSAVTNSKLANELEQYATPDDSWPDYFPALDHIW